MEVTNFLTLDQIGTFAIFIQFIAILTQLSKNFVDEMFNYLNIKIKTDTLVFFYSFVSYYIYNIILGNKTSLELIFVVLVNSLFVYLASIGEYKVLTKDKEV